MSLNIDGSAETIARFTEQQNVFVRLREHLLWVANEADIESFEVIVWALAVWWTGSMFGDPTQFEKLFTFRVLASYADQEVLGGIAAALAVLHVLPVGLFGYRDEPKVWQWIRRTRRAACCGYALLFGWVTGSVWAVSPLIHTVGPYALYTFGAAWLTLRLRPTYKPRRRRSRRG